MGIESFAIFLYYPFNVWHQSNGLSFTSDFGNLCLLYFGGLFSYGFINSFEPLKQPTVVSLAFL